MRELDAIEFRAMGSAIRAIVDATPVAATRALVQVPTWFETWEHMMSRFRPDSELSRVNAESGRWVHVSPGLCEVIGVALEAARSTEGLVDPTLLDAMLAAGYDRTFEELDANAPPPPVAASPNGSGWWDIICDPALELVYVPAGVHFDLGGIGKGWSADRAAEQLAQVGPALVDAGGDIAVSGPPAEGEGWPVSVTDPRDPSGETSLMTLKLTHGGVATSGKDFRRWTRQGEAVHHIMDPKTRRPAETDALTATVIAGSATEAEAAAKASLIKGLGQGLAWLEARPGLAGVMVSEGGEVVTTSNLEPFVWS
jgi:FAD:protein FMN transferase